MSHVPRHALPAILPPNNHPVTKHGATDRNPAEIAAGLVTSRKPGRITGLDAARGLMLITSVMSASVVLNRPDWLLHASWMGITPYDLIFPLFVTLSGVGMAFAYRNHVSRWVSLRRIVVLLLVGIIYGMVAAGDYTWAGFRITGTLQLYAGLVALLVLGHMLGRTWPVWAAITFVSAAVLACYLHCYGTLCPGGGLTPMCNPSKEIDGFFFHSHMYSKGTLGHDPEGIVSILGSFVTAAAGTTAGHMALASRGRLAHLGALRLGVWAAVVTAYGVLLSSLVPAFKRLWTPSFGLCAAAVGILLFAICFWIFDAPSSEKWSNLRPRVAIPLVALGRNSLLVYFGSHLLVDILMRVGQNAQGESLGFRIASVCSLGIPGAWASLGFVVVNLALWWIISLVLHHHKIYIHA